MDGVIESFPPPYTEYACPRRRQVNFNVRVREACREEMMNMSLKVVKSIVIGDLSVGKSSMVNRYCRNLFEMDYKPTIGVEYEVKKYQVLNQEFHLQLWDTSGEERFKCITGAYYRGANIIIVAFDLNDAASLTNVSKWLDDALEKTRTTTPEIFMVGNKLDLMTKQNVLEDVRESAISIANELNAEYWEVSAKTGANVVQFFTRVAALCFDQAVLRELDTGTPHSKKVQVGTGIGLTGARNTADLHSAPIVLGSPEHNGTKVHAAYSSKSSKCC